jgi:hypothetical protein
VYLSQDFLKGKLYSFKPSNPFHIHQYLVCEWYRDVCLLPERYALCLPTRTTVLDATRPSFRLAWPSYVKAFHCRLEAMFDLGLKGFIVDSMILACKVAFVYCTTRAKRSERCVICGLPRRTTVLLAGRLASRETTGGPRPLTLGYVIGVDDRNVDGCFD